MNARQHPLHFLPLGGAGEIGMNLNLYEYAGSWLMCDLGVTFAGDELPGIDLVMPDISFIERRRGKLLGLILTHAHEDHLGAVPYLWPRLRCPVYATPFTAALLNAKLDEGADGIEDIEITEVPLGGTVTLGPFRVELFSLTHSIPEPNALIVHTPVGTVMHTGDWKLDPDPLISLPVDEPAIRARGDAGILAMVCDSTNVFQPGSSGSEADVRTSLVELVGGCRGRVAITTFASNLTRLLSVHAAAESNGRKCVAVGRSMWRIIKCAKMTGYLPERTHFLSDREARKLDPDKVLYMLTGSQGEPNAALSRIAGGTHQNVRLEAGDTVIFSSKIIPGNEKPIFDLINRLAHLEVEIITETDSFVHVSGHPNREELERMYRLVRPAIAVPVHGEVRHLKEHARLARSLQVPSVVQAGNGSLVRFAPGEPAVVEEVEHGRLAWTGSRTVPVNGTVVRERRHMVSQGVAFVTLVADHEGDLVADPAVTLLGLREEDDPEADDELILDVADAFENLPAGRRKDDAAVVTTVRRTLKHALDSVSGRRPVIRVEIVRI